MELAHFVREKSECLGVLIDINVFSLLTLHRPIFSAEEYGMTMDDFMAEIRGRLLDGRWIVGVEVFRQLYGAVGFGTIVALTRLPGISQGLGLVYRLFAKNRLRLTRRCTTETCQIK